MGRPEDSRVKIPALVHLTRLGYEYKSIKDLIKNIDYDGETNIFYDIFQESINRINNISLSINDVKKLIEEIKIKCNNNDLGKSFYKVLQEGINGIRLLDFNDKDLNSYIVVTELPYENGDDNFRPDITILLNGMPLSFIEVKRQNNREGILAEHNRMQQRFSNPIYKRFVNMTQFTVFSNNNEYDDTDIAPIQGAFYASSSYGKMFFNKFREQNPNYIKAQIKDINSDIEEFILKDSNLQSIKWTPEYKSSIDPDSPTNRILSSLYTKDRIKFIIQYGLCYKETVDEKGITHIEKHIMRYPQMFATLAIKDSLDKNIKKGIIWHTQGSGKTALAYYNLKFLKNYYQNQGKIAKFYFIVDRIDLATQAKDEFEARGLKVVTVDSKEEFKTNIASFGETDKSGQTTFTVVNIQKFSEESITKKSDYNVNVQRIYFLDEAHRSYNPKGSFLANLMTSDKEAAMFALTGTPLIGDGYNTKDIFGNYIHKYYYNQSISDGYTLKLIREEIETTYKTKLSNLLKEIEVKAGTINKKDLYSHSKFVTGMIEYILSDFKKSRMRLDNSIGAMIVCDSSEQAREIDKQLNEVSSFSHALVLHDEGTKKERKEIQRDFKKGKIDILVVYNMLLTGFDAPRLKKQYLARMIKAHSLLQTLTRVNRPYKNFLYGFVVDFANIKEEFDKTNKAYFDELQSELGDEIKNYSEIFKSHEEIEQDIINIKNQLFLYNTENVVEFINQINEIEDIEQLRNLKNALELYKVLYNLIRLFGYDDLFIHFDINKSIQLLNEVTNRINIINFKQNIENADISNILNVALDQIDFQFRKIREEELIIADSFRNELEKTRHEVVDRCLDIKDPESITLLEELKRIFKKKNIEELTADEMKDLMQDLENIRKKAKKRNDEDQLLAKKYDGDIKYMRTHKRIMENNPPLASAIKVHDILMDVKLQIDESVAHRENILDTKEFFIHYIRPLIVKACKEHTVCINMEQLKYINMCIAQEYLNERSIAS